MTYERLKKGLVSLIVSATVILSVGFASSSIASAQRYDRDYQRHDDRWNQQRERAEMWRIRRLDREHQIRFRMNSSTRVAGYYDRFGRFHAYGYYDAFGRFHRY
jgi:hypothetical protein